MHGARRQAHAELYMGLVESGVGLLPAGGGCKEMTLHALDAAASVREGGRSESVEVFEALRRNFETVAMAKVSTSAVEARRFGFLWRRGPHHDEPRPAAYAMPSSWRWRWPTRGTRRRRRAPISRRRARMCWPR